MSATQTVAIKTITFSDHGQDFLEWDLDATGRVVACRPFQGSTWCKATVTNHAYLRRGSVVVIRINGRDTYVRYPLIKVGKPKPPGHLSKAVLNSKVVEHGAQGLLANYMRRKTERDE